MKLSISNSNLGTLIAGKFDKIRQYWRDLIITFILAAIAGLAVHFGDQLIQINLLADKTFDDVWFTADIPRVVHSMAVSPQKGSLRFFLHPLFSEFTYPPVFILQHVFGLNAIEAVRVVMSIVAALWLGVFYALLRVIGCQRLDAVLFSLLAASSASVIFWFVVPETFSFSSLGILLALAIVPLGQRLQISPPWYIAANVLTLSFTVTNWMFGILATVVNHSRKRSIQIILSSFCLVAILSVLIPFLGWMKNLSFHFQILVLLLGSVTVAVATAGSILFKRTHPTLNPLKFLANLLQKRSVQLLAGGCCIAVAVIQIKGELEFMLLPQSGGPLAAIRAFFFHSMVMPAIHLVDLVEKNDLSVLPKMTIQASAAGSGSPWGALAVGLWAALLGLGCWSWFFLKPQRKLRRVLGLTLLGQLLLHLLYGAETFLYVLDFAPVLFVIAALTTLTRFRWVALTLAVLVMFSAGANNIVQYQQAIDYFHHYGTLQQGVDQKS